MSGATVTISPTASGSTVNFNGLTQTGLGRSICTTTRNSSTGSSTGKVLTVDQTTSLKVNSGSLLTITCQRQMSSDSKGQYADAQTLVFNTSAGSYQVPMVTIGLSPRVSVQEAVANLESSVNSKIAEVKTDLTSTVNTVAKEAGNSIQGLQNGFNLLQSSNPHDKSQCTWHAVATHGQYICPDRKFVAGACFTNNVGGCAGPNGTRTDDGSQWGAGGAVLCCNVD